MEGRINVRALLSQGIEDLDSNFTLVIPTALALLASLLMLVAVYGFEQLRVGINPLAGLPEDTTNLKIFLLLFFISLVFSQYAQGVTAAMVDRILDKEREDKSKGSGRVSEEQVGELSLGYIFKAGILLTPTLLPLAMLTASMLFAGLMMFILPMVVVFVVIIYSIPILVLEDVSGGEALSNSLKLVRDNFWPSVALAMAIMTIVLGLYFVNNVLASIKTEVLAEIQMEVLVYIVSLVLTGMVGAITTSMIVRAYRTLVPKSHKPQAPLVEDEDDDDE